MLRLLCVLLLSASLLGCASSNYVNYQGEQEDWPTSKGTLVDNKYPVPVYFGLPNKPYIILGYLDATTAPVRRSGVVGYAAKKAKKAGGDAIILISQGAEYRGTYHSGSANSHTNMYGNQTGNMFSATANTDVSYNATSLPMYAGKAECIVIRFK